MNRGIYEEYIQPDILAHHGILGQKWGVRRYQNEDGTLTEIGKRRARFDSTSRKWGNAQRQPSTIASRTLTKLHETHRNNADFLTSTKLGYAIEDGLANMYAKALYKVDGENAKRWIAARMYSNAYSGGNGYNISTNNTSLTPGDASIFINNVRRSL